MASSNAHEASAGKMGKLRQQIQDQALLVEDLENELDHTNLHFRQTAAELNYQKGLVERSRLLEEEQEQSTIDELRYQNHVLQLELQGMYNTSKMYDYQEVDEQNRDLRATISELHQENLQLNQLIAEDGQAAQEREGQTRLFLEREYREQLRGAEGRLKEELFGKLDERTKNIVLQHRRLQEDLFLLKYNIKEFDSRYRQMDDKRRVLNIDNTINKEMNEMMVKEIVGLKKKLKQSEEKRHAQEDTISQLRGQLHLQQEAGIARTPEELLSSHGGASSADSESQTGTQHLAMGGIAQVTSLKHEIARSKKKEKLMREQRDMWRSRAFKLELMCSGLQDDLSAAIQAAKTIVNQSETSVWNTDPGPGDGDAVPWLDYDVTDPPVPQHQQHDEIQGGLQSRMPNYSLQASKRSTRPASAHPQTGARFSRPGSDRPKLTGGKARPRSALPASGSHPTQIHGKPQGIRIQAKPLHPETNGAYCDTEKLHKDDIQANMQTAEDDKQTDAIQFAYVGIVPTGGYTLNDSSMPSDLGIAGQGPTPIQEDNLGIIEDIDDDPEDSAIRRDAAVSSRLLEPHTPMNAAANPEITIVGMGGEVTQLLRPRRQTACPRPNQQRAQSARPASARPPLSRGQSVSAASPSLSQTSQAQSPKSSSKRRPVSAVHSGSSSLSRVGNTGIIRRPHSATPTNNNNNKAGNTVTQTASLRRGQSATDFIRSTRSSYMYNGRPFA